MKGLIESPSNKAIKILKDIKSYISLQKNTRNNIQSDIDWIIESINSYSMYKYEIMDKDNINILTEENHQVKQLIESMETYNSEIEKIKKEYETLYIKANKIEGKIGILQMPSIKMKKIVFVNNNNRSMQMPKKNKIINRCIINFPSISKKREENLSFSNFVVKNTRNIYSCEKQFNYDMNIRNHPFINYSNTSSDYLINVRLPRSKENKNKKFFHFNTEKNKKYNKSISFIKDKNFSNSNENKKYPFVYCEEILNRNNYDLKNILEKDFNLFELKEIIGHENILPIMGKTILSAFGIDNRIISTTKLESFLTSVSNTYLKSTLYHNSLHGSDVTHTISMIFLNSNAEDVIGTRVLDIISIIIGYNYILIIELWVMI